jgi:hypothetical protein
MDKYPDSDLLRLRKIFCTCNNCEYHNECLEDGTISRKQGDLCCGFRVDGLTGECEDNCPGFFEMWTELMKLLDVAD